MYDQGRISERLDHAEAQLGWRPVYHSLEEVDRMKHDLEAIAVFDDAGKFKETIRPFTQKEINWIRNERMVCACDASYYLTRYAYLKDDKNQIVRFKFRNPQIVYYNVISELERIGSAIQLAILKGRQLGVSSLTELLVAHRIFFYYGINAVIASSNQQATQIMSQMIFLAYDTLPYWMKPTEKTRKESERGEITFHNRSGVSFQHGSQTTGIARGHTPTLVHLSEVASYPNADELIDASLFRAVHESPEVFMVLESTAEGIDNWWHNTWKHSKSTLAAGGRSKLYPLFLPWYIGTEMYPKPTWLKTRPVPDDWRPNRETELRMAKAKVFVANSPLLAKVLGDEWELGREQAWFSEVDFEEYKAKGKEKLWAQEMACVGGDTMVSTDLGIVRIDQAYTASTCESGAITQWIPRGEREVFSLKTMDGRCLRATPDHRIHMADGSWREMANLKSGDVVRLSVPMFAKEEYVHKWNDTPIYSCERTVDTDMARFLGYFMGDGSFVSGTVAIACDAQDVDIVEDVERLFQKITGRQAHREYVGKMIRVRQTNQYWAPLLRSMGCLKPKIHVEGRTNGYTRKVCVPECIMRSPRHAIKEFLSALYECDGHAYKDSPRVKLFSSHDDFLLSVQELLLGFGIRGKMMKISRRSGHNLKGGKQEEYFGRSLETPAAFANVFYDDIGFIGKRKQESGKRQTSLKYANRELVDIVLSVNQTGCVESVFDLSVTDSHKFSASGIEVHNCDDVECFQGSFDSVFGNDLLQQLHEVRTINHSIYQITGEGIEDKFNPFQEDVDTQKPIRILQYRNKREDVYRWNLVPIRNEVVQVPDDPTDSAMEDAVEQADGKLFIFHEPRLGMDYTIGVDSSKGVGRDSTVISVWAKGQGGAPDIQCAEFASAFVSHVEAYAFAMAIATLYSKFMGDGQHREPLLSIEVVEAVGDMIQLQMSKMGYKRFHQFIRYDGTNPSKKDSKRRGWYTVGWSRPLLIDGFVHSVKNGWIEIHSPFLLAEMRKFEIHFTGRGKERLEHSSGSHDDRVFASAIAVFTAHDLDLMIERGKKRYIPSNQINKPKIDLGSYNPGKFVGDQRMSDQIKSTRDIENLLAERFY